MAATSSSRSIDGNLNLLDTKQLTASPAIEDSPSLIAVGNSFLLAYQSWSTGIDSGGDIFLNGYDQNWKLQGTEQLTDQKSYQDRPSLAYAEGNLYVAYVSREMGNLDIFQKKLDGNLEVLETKRLTSDKSDQDYPSLKWMNGQFMLLYASKKTGGYEIMLDRYLRDGKSIDSTVVVAAPRDQTSSSMAYSALDGKYWVAYTSKDVTGQNIYVKPLMLTNPSQLKPCDIAASFSIAKANSPYVLTLRFYNNYGQLWDPDDLSLSWSPQDAARQSDKTAEDFHRHLPVEISVWRQGRQELQDCSQHRRLPIGQDRAGEGCLGSGAKRPAPHILFFLLLWFLYTKGY